jgi:dihydrofolate synthase / folylpolyglutamate synthase
MPIDDTDYQQALDYLYRFVDYSLVRNFRHTPEKFDLMRMEVFLGLLNEPHKRYPVVHVAGTKGKGSTAALITSALRAQGYRVGLYTSPHLQEFNERIQVNGEPIAPRALVQLVDDLRPLIDQVEQITWFEITTGLAFEHFSRQKVDVAVIEVGLGGRLDATNVVEPLVSVITSLSMDHMNILGDTLAKIAFEKAGIIKPGRPLALAPQPDEARAVVEQIAAERGSPVLAVGRDVKVTPLAHSLDGQSVRIEVQGGQAAELSIPLLGLHQVENAATAYAALQLVRQQGLVVSEEAIRAGFAGVNWPARFELLRRDPPVIVDSAHNRDSAQRLRQALDDYLPGREVVLLFGASEDKDVTGILEELLPRVREVVATQSIHPRAALADNLVALSEQSGRPAVAVMPLEAAVEVALARAGQDAAVLATGSLFIAAAVRAVWQARATEI